MRTRIISGVVVAPILIAAIFWTGGSTPFPGWPFAALVLYLTLRGLFEFYRGCRAADQHPLTGFGYVAGALFVGLATPVLTDPGGTLLKVALTILIMGSLATEALRPHRAPLGNLGSLWLGAVYVGWLFPFVLRLRLVSFTEPELLSRLGWSLPADWMRSPGEGAWLVLFTIVVTSSVDTGAYFAGKALGKHKMAPVLSPGKTWEGAVGGFLAALLFAGLLSWWLRLPLAFALTAAALIGVLAQIGDLSKSAIKREIGIKDFGSLIPGHGGVLDRFDSLLFTAPTVYWLMALWPS